MNYYNIPAASGNQSGSMLMLPVVGENLFGIRLCSYTNEAETIDAQTVYSDAQIGSMQVFKHTDGYNYVVNYNRLYGSDYSFINDGSFIVLGMEHDHHTIYDVNRECEFASGTFDKYSNWFVMKNISPALCLFVNKRGLKPTQYSRIVATSHNILVNPLVFLGTTISNYADVYISESISLQNATKVSSEGGINTIELSFTNASDQVMEIRPRAGVIFDGAMALQNGKGTVRTAMLTTTAGNLDPTMFDVYLDNRRISTISIKDI